MPRVFASSDPGRAGAQWALLYFGTGFTALGALLLERALERILAVIFAPEFAWAVMLFALFGLAVGGWFSHAITRRSGNVSVELGRLTFLNQIVIVLLLWFLTSRHGWPGVSAFVTVGLACGVPFFFVGTVLAAASAEACERIHRAYAYLFSFAAVPCLLLVPFLRLLGGPNTVLTAAVVFGIASAIWFNRGGDGNLRALGALVALMLVALIGINGVNHVFDTRWSLDEQIGAERFSQWNTYSRIGLREDQPVVTWDGMPYEYTELEDGARGGEHVAMELRPGGDVLVMGGLPGVIAAARNGASSITVVERNPTISRRILEPSDDWLGVELAAEIDAGVEIDVVTRNERAFLEALGAGQRFDVIQISLPLDPSLVPEKKALLTVEGLSAAFGRLKPEGILSLTLPAQARESMEIAAAAQAVAGKSSGRVLQLWDINRLGDQRDTLLISDGDWMPVLEESGLAPVLLPAVAPQWPLPTDERPYTAYLDPAEEMVTQIVFRLGDRPTLLREYAMHLLLVPGAVMLLLAMFGSAWFVLRRKQAGQAASGSMMAPGTTLLWMAASGLGVGLAMASLITRWGPVVRNPTYLLTVALCFFLLSAALAAQRADVLLSHGRGMPVALAVLGAVVTGWCGTGAAANLILGVGADSAFSGVVLLALLVVPAGAALGLAIPSAMGQVRDSSAAGPVWSAFVVAVVTGMTLSLPISMAIGLTAAIWIGAVLLGAAFTAQALGWVLPHPATAVA